MCKQSKTNFLLRFVPSCHIQASTHPFSLTHRVNAVHSVIKFDAEITFQLDFSRKRGGYKNESSRYHSNSPTTSIKLLVSKVLCWVFLVRYFNFLKDPCLKKSSTLLSEHMCPCWVSELPVNGKSQSLSLLACYAFWKCWCIWVKGLFVKSQRTQIPLPSQCQVNFPKNWLNSAFWGRFVASLFLFPSKHVDAPTKNQI